MQFCDLEDLSKKFNIVKMLRIGSTIRPRFNCSGDFTFPSSGGDIIYSNSHTDVDDLVIDSPVNPANENENPGNKDANIQTATRKDQRDNEKNDNDLNGEENKNNPNSLEESTEKPSMEENQSSTDPPVDPTSDDFVGPLTRCIEEENDLLTEDQRFVPNNNTIRVKIFLPNKYPIYVILRQDATVQDAIEKAIRKSNAFYSVFQKKYNELKEEEKKKAIETIDTTEESLPEIEDDDIRHDSIDGLTEFLDQEDLRPSRRRRDNQLNEGEVVNGVRVEDIVGAHCMTLLEDSMAYELRFESENGDCDLDFPALERGGILMNFFEMEEQGFCMVQVPDYQPRSSTTPLSADEQIEIRLMFDDDVFSIELPAISTCRQLLNEARHRLTPGRVYELTVAPEDKERLKMVSEVVNENVRLCDLDISSFRIRLKRFFDGPRITSYSMNTYTSESTSRKDMTFDPSSYIFTNFEAGKYKEWVVWKFTSKGKQRKRIFAIGFDYINICHTSPFNQCNGCGYGNNTYISFSDIIDVQLDENHPGVFSLFYADDYSDYEDSDIARPPEPQKIEEIFQAMSVEDSCDIVNRIQHLMRKYH